MRGIKINVVQVTAGGYLHSEAYREASEFLFFQLKKIGVQAEYGTKLISGEWINIVFGAHLAPDVFLKCRENIVIFNTEQLSAASSWTSRKEYFTLLNEYPVWDYSQSNLALIEKGKKWLVNFLYEECLSRINLSEKKEIDLLFYGSIDARRTSLIEELRVAGLKVHPIHGVYGKDRDRMIASSRAVLNLHYYPTQIFQQIRCFYPLINSVPVVSESFPYESCPEIYRNVIFHPNGKKEFVDFVTDLLRDQPKFSSCSQDMLSLYRGYSELDEFKSVVFETVDFFKGGAMRSVAQAAGAAPSNYYDGVNLKLLDSIPPGKKKILEIGCAKGRLGSIFKSRFPGTVWHGVDFSKEALESAKKYLDGVIWADVDDPSFSDLIDRDYDLIVLGDVLEHLKSPHQLLGQLLSHTKEFGQLVCCIPNMSHVSVLRRMITGDLTYDDSGLLDRTHLRFLSPASSSKMFLDSGWLPDMVDEYRVEMDNSAVSSHLASAAVCLGIPKSTVIRNFGSYQSIFLCCKREPFDLCERRAEHLPAGKFSVIVPVNRGWQAALNVDKSPGLKEVSAEIIYVEGRNAAEAYAKGALKARHEWHLFVHQDVYFPHGTGFQIERLLGEQRGAALDVPLGFAGLARIETGTDRLEKAGLVLDRTRLFSHPESDRGISIDELAVCLHASSRLRIDPKLGWHLWATDLCLQSEVRAGQPSAKILQVPLFHNSVGEYTLPKEFIVSANYLLNKYPLKQSIHTLCGVISRKGPSEPLDTTTRVPHLHSSIDESPSVPLS